MGFNLFKVEKKEIVAIEGNSKKLIFYVFRYATGATPEQVKSAISPGRFFELVKANKPDFNLRSTLVVNLSPNGPMTCIGKSEISLDANSPLSNEPYTAYYLSSSNGELKPFKRFPFENFPGKIPRLSMIRKSDEVSTHAIISITQKTEDLLSCNIDIISSAKPFFLSSNFKLDRVEDGIIKTKWGLLSPFWSVRVDQKPASTSDSEIVLNCSLYWLGKDSKCNLSITTAVESDAGFLPIRRVNFENGQAQVRLRTDHLKKNDIVNLTFSLPHYKNISTAPIKIS